MNLFISPHIRWHTPTIAFAAIMIAGCSAALAEESRIAQQTASGWPEFRGPGGTGMAPPSGGTPGLPLHWSENENVVWKTPIPFQGWSSPVILDNQIWITTATEEGQDFYALCVDAATGQILFNERLFHSDHPEPLGNNVNSYASPTPVLEPGRVYIHFGSYGTACLDTATFKTLWVRQDLPCRHFRGPGSSPISFENLLLLTFDGADVQYLTALDKETGASVWKTERSTEWRDLDANGQPRNEGDFRKAFTTPTVVPAGEVPLVISPGSYATLAYEARTGKEIWKLPHHAYSPAPRPVFGNGLIFFVTGRGAAELCAMRPAAQGEIDDSCLLWKYKGNKVPSEPSPLFVDGLLYLISNDSYATCLDADTGAEIWQERLGGNYMSSPIYADGRIYIGSVQGKISVLKAGKEYELLATNMLESGFLASPAVIGKAIILRSKTHLYRIEENN